MKLNQTLPRILVIDDLFGRTLLDRRNEDRANLCGQFLLQDITGDETDKGPGQRIRNPIAEAVFCRGQKPSTSGLGDTVENDPLGILEAIQESWSYYDRPNWSLV